ncbi:hypothetical protein [Pseudarthrobacter sp. H2]|uniref:hypothetical protein n=1 Tax=Pseudarthrobacter sp. H2 TaxID=3418415 RepID=UPI003CF81331
MMHFLMAGALFLLALARVPAVARNGKDPVFLAAMFAGSSSLLGNPGVYLFTDALLGGTNLAKLAVNTFMIVGLWFLRTAVVNAISPEADKRAAWIRCLPVAVTLVLQAAFFFLTGPMPSTATWGEYHRFPFAAPFSLMMIAFIGWSCGEIAWACCRFVPRMRQSFRIGFSMVGLGSVISVVTMVLMALGILSHAFPQLTPLHGAANAPFQMLEMFAIVLVGVGLTIPAVAGRAARRLASLRMLRTIAKIEPIRVKALKNADMARLLETDAAARPQERLHRMIVEIWDAELAAGAARSALTDGDRAYLLTVESDLNLERTS